MDDIIKDAEDWLKQYGYSVHNYSVDYKQVTLTNCNFEYLNWEYFPSITCWVNSSGERRCKLSYNGLKMFLSLKSGEIQYRHPDIIKYITVMVNYTKAMQSINPFN